MSMSNHEREDEYRRWSPPLPAKPGSGLTTAITGKGLVEIKPHTSTGRKAGLAQLRSRVTAYPQHSMWLVTYQATDPSGTTKVHMGKARAIKVWAERFQRGQLTGDSYDLGTVPLPSSIPFPPVDEPGAFGMAVEKSVQERFGGLLAKARKPVPGTGGGRPGPDLLWNELVAMYRELAGELRDPFYAELAAEFGRLADEVGLAA